MASGNGQQQNSSDIPQQWLHQKQVELKRLVQRLDHQLDHQLKRWRQQLDQKLDQLGEHCSQKLEQHWPQLEQKVEQLGQHWLQQLEQEQQQQQQLQQQELHQKELQQQELQQQQQLQQKLEQLRQHNTLAVAYTQAVKQGKHAANQFKLVMLGAEGAGKTSTVHSLFGEDFQPHQPSTIGADIHNTCTVDRYCVTDWNLKELHEHLKDIPILFKHELQETMVEPDDSELNQENLEDMDLTVAKDLIQNVVTPDGKIRIVIYDLGGQEVFYEIHFLFLASCDVVFLTFDASKSLDEPVARRQRYTISEEAYKTRKMQTNYQVIETTLHAIYSHCGVKGNKDSLSPRIPTVMMVGTHAFNLTVEEKNIITRTLFSRLACKPLSDHLPRNITDAIHFIDNKERNTTAEGFKHLKAVAVRAADSAITEERPVSYLKFEEKILEISQKETVIEVEHVHSIASSAGIEDSPDSLLTLLQYYSSKGILLYYPEVKELKNLIFISPQNVSDLVSCVIKTHNYSEPMPSAALRKKFDRFDEFGILEESLLDDILERSGYAKNNVLAFLEKFDLAVEIDKDTKFKNEDDSYKTPDTGRVYFIPSMLVYNEGEKYIKPEGHIDNIVLYYFPDKFLPDTVFNHVLISTIKWCQGNGHHTCRVLRGIGVFDFKSRKQGFALGQCSTTSSIKCSVFVHQHEMCNKDLWQQRKDLVHKHLPSFILDAHSRCISKAQQPITYMECPLQHDENCAPHIRLDTLSADTDVWCTKVNPKKCISRDTYSLLVKPDAHPAVGSVTVECAVEFSQNKDDLPTMRDLNRHVVHKYASDWEDIAYELGLDEQIAIIKKDHRECVDCLRKILQIWLESTVPHATWRMLEVAITNVKRIQKQLDPVTDIYVS